MERLEHETIETGKKNQEQSTRYQERLSLKMAEVALSKHHQLENN